MKKHITLIILCCLVVNAFGNKPNKKTKILNVWAINGLPLIQGPGLGDIIMRVPYGAAVTVIDTDFTSKPHTVAFNNPVTKKPYNLLGQWVKVIYANKQGFVFSGYLSAMPCLKKATHVEADEVYLKRNYGEPKIVKNKTKGSTTLTYKNGIIEITSHSDGCADVSLNLVHISYQDAILFSKVWLFEGDAANDIKAEILKNGSIRLSYNACD